MLHYIARANEPFFFAFSLLNIFGRISFHFGSWMTIWHTVFLSSNSSKRKLSWHERDWELRKKKLVAKRKATAVAVYWCYLLLKQQLIVTMIGKCWLATVDQLFFSEEFSTFTDAISNVWRYVASAKGLKKCSRGPDFGVLRFLAKAQNHGNPPSFPVDLQQEQKRWSSVSISMSTQTIFLSSMQVKWRRQEMKYVESPQVVQCLHWATSNYLYVSTVSGGCKPV